MSELPEYQTPSKLLQVYESDPLPVFYHDAPELTTNVPQKLKGNTGKDNFESLLLQFAKREHQRFTMGRYGVTCIRRGPNDIMAVPSKPDFDGTIMGGKQFNVEAKVTTKSSFGLGEEFFKESQYNWMSNKARYGVLCFLVIHFNARSGKTFSEPALTVRIRVASDMPLWQGYEKKEILSITRPMALEVGEVIPWVKPKGCKKPLPYFI